MSIKTHCDGCGDETLPPFQPFERDPNITLRFEGVMHRDGYFHFCNWDCVADWAKAKANA